MKRQHPILFLFAVACALTAPLLGCSGETLDGGSNGTRFSCDNRGIESTCAEFSSGTTEAFAEDHCDGTVIKEPCPPSASVGRCSASGDGGELTNVYYSDGPKAWTETSARETCEKNFSGTFRAP
jgi:hypothetical protein